LQVNNGADAPCDSRRCAGSRRTRSTSPQGVPCLRFSEYPGFAQIDAKRRSSLRTHSGSLLESYVFGCGGLDLNQRLLRNYSSRLLSLPMESGSYCADKTANGLSVS
jgi:hypothetical protein